MKKRIKGIVMMDNDRRAYIHFSQADAAEALRSLRLCRDGAVVMITLEPTWRTPAEELPTWNPTIDTLNAGLL